ncbi:glycosyltransferase family 4 protein [Cupriavidus basilensis]|uniref:glycosyltransferase family 4 protein n=1 Tax=Cupriavidus basilensis TaxID=68895 RepID=UPI0023E85208|nr:glycosyltransferase family 4 protein [Cupriavidus basilensis]MDF3886715.1 glycosyltransferase family 4 protein [Cupriavidus basilensis]
MRILVTANLTPFLRGGADYHIKGLVNALEAAGHDAELLRLPFRFSPEADITRAMAHAESLDLVQPNGMTIDQLISLQFPGYGIAHPNHRIWVMHQHRAVYELYDDQAASTELRTLKPQIEAFDSRALAGARAVFANSARVAERLAKYNGVRATPLYHPPAFAARFYCEEALPYVFFPSRLETLKRQQLVIEAARLMRSDLTLILAGGGGQQHALDELIKRYDLGARVRLIGHISEQEKFAWYARALAVLFPPRDEDYGYITLEAMLSAKPVLTCTDSGGPVEFVRHEETGWIESPEPAALAARLDWIAHHRPAAAIAGQHARQAYAAAGISWDNVVAALTKRA